MPVLDVRAQEGSATEAPALRAPDGREPPALPPGADPNDWEAYFDLGVRLLAVRARDAEAAFARAAQLRPDRAEPLFGAWVAFHGRDHERFARYLRDDERTLRDPAVLRADAARALAFWRNPFVHQGLIVGVMDQLPGRWNEDLETRGWLALARADLPRATDLFGQVVRRSPDRNGWLRFVRASAFVNGGRPDSALAELTALLAQRRAADERRTVGRYEPKAMLEYASGLLHLQGRRSEAAREAFGRALVEDAAYAPAHAMLGAMAQAAGDSTAALLELGTATQLAPDDPVFHLWHADALERAGRPGEAAIALRRATALAPRWPDPHRRLALVLARAGDAAGARDANAAFLARAPRRDPSRGAAEQEMGR